MSNTATARQIDFYTSLVQSIVSLAPQHAEASATALAVFPSLPVAEASAKIDKAKATLATLRAEAPFAPVAEASSAPEFPVWPGTYTVVSPTGRRTFKVEVQASDASFAPGRTILSYLSGQDNESDFTGFAFLDGSTIRPWKRHKDATELLGFAAALVADPDAALVSKHCARCNRKLTTPESITAGLGPECIKMGLR